jgi:hypothetical protein
MTAVDALIKHNWLFGYHQNSPAKRQFYLYEQISDHVLKSFQITGIKAYRI